MVADTGGGLWPTGPTAFRSTEGVGHRQHNSTDNMHTICASILVSDYKAQKASRSGHPPVVLETCGCLAIPSVPEETFSYSFEAENRVGVKFGDLRAVMLSRANLGVKLATLVSEAHNHERISHE